MRLAEIGSKVKERRLALGLTQAQLSRLSGLPITTVACLEKGEQDDIGYTRLVELLAILGLGIDLRMAKGLENAIEIAARTASTSYKNVLSPEVLVEMLESGTARPEYHPHLTTLLDDTPLPVVIQAIREAALHSSTLRPRKMLMHMAAWARELGANRDVW